MKEPFDKKLAQKIRDSFEAHEEPFDPKEWDRFSSAYFGKSRKPLAAWWLWAGGIAASLLLIGALWNPFQTFDMISESTTPLAYSTEKANGSLGDSTEAENEIASAGKLGGSTAKPISEAEPNNIVATNTPSSTSDPRSAKNPTDLNPTAGSISQAAFKSEPTPEEPILEGPKTVPATEPSVSHPQALTETQIPTIEEAQQKINSWMAEAMTEETAEETDEKKEKSLKLGVLMAPQSISNSTQNINFGAGLMSEIAFSKRLRLDVGVGYARQNLVPDQNGGGRLLASDAATAENTKANLFSGNYINSTSELSFGQIEIPLNMKYSVVQKKTADFYLVSGFSNMFYVNQQKTTTFNTVAFASNAMTADSQTLNSTSISEAPASTESQVDVGQLINLGMGFEQKLKNGTSISFEPFYKFTLGNQTFVNQQFAIGGINLRMNFQLKK